MQASERARRARIAEQHEQRIRRMRAVIASGFPIQPGSLGRKGPSTTEVLADMFGLSRRRRRK